MSENIEEKAAVAVEATPAAEPAKAAAPAEKRKKGGRMVPSGIAYVLATFNNTKVTFTDLHGNVLCWSTGGKNGFKGSRKSTAYAAQVVAADAAKKAAERTYELMTQEMKDTITANYGDLEKYVETKIESIVKHNH